MPNFDKTGPKGQGPATGQGQGSCTNNQQKSFGNGFGGNRGCCQRGGGRGKFFQQENNAVSLDEQEKILEDRLEAVRAAKKESNSKN